VDNSINIADSAVLALDEEEQNLLDGPRITHLPIAERVMDERVNYILHTIMQDVITQGTGKRALKLERNDLAGKTGTTNDQKDAWFSGYNSQLVATAWVGFDQPQPLGRNEFGSTAALPIWIDFMEEALRDMPELQRPQPNNMVATRINKDTGLLATQDDQNSMFEIFREELAPTETSPSNKDNASDSVEELAPEEVF
jgi:penicillin-binding protein 1A